MYTLVKVNQYGIIFYIEKLLGYFFVISRKGPIRWNFFTHGESAFPKYTLYHLAQAFY